MIRGSVPAEACRMKHVIEVTVGCVGVAVPTRG